MGFEEEEEEGEEEEDSAEEGETRRPSFKTRTSNNANNVGSAKGNEM